MDERERAPRPPAEGVRIIGAEEAAAALEGGEVARRRPDTAPRFGDVPEPPTGPRPAHRFPLPDDVDPSEAVPRGPVAAGGTTELPHWTEPPTGEVPRVLITDEDQEEDDLAAWSAVGRAPRWRDQHSDWEEADFDDASVLTGDEAPLGALDSDRTEHSDLFSFDEPVAEPDPEPAAPRAIRSSGRAPRPAPSTHAIPPLGAGGRDVGVAVGTGVAVGVFALLCFALGPVATMVLVVAVLTLCAVEVFDVLRRAGYRPATLLGLTATVSIAVASYSRGETALPLVVALTTMFAFFWYLSGVTRARPTINVAVTLLGFLWVGFLGSYAALMLGLPQRHGIAFLLGAVITTVAADVGAFVVGRQMGRHPLAPAVSPNKTWEGLAGGMTASVLAGLLVVAHIHPWSASDAFWLAVVVGVVAPLGDLAESMIKRDIGIKDMGTLLPGHGGLLDRFDAMLFVLPATYYLVRLLDLA